MILRLLASFLLVALVYRYQTRPKIRRDGQKLRSAPDTLPLLGNAIKFLQPRHVLFDWFVQCQRRYGRDTLEISVPSLPPGVIVNDPVNLDFVLRNETSITKGDFFKERSWDLFGHGIINASGEIWKAQRKAGLKFFSGTNLDFMVEDVLPDAYSKMKIVLDEAVSTKAIVDMQKLFLDLTTSVVGQMAYDAMKMDIDASSPFSKAFDYASDQIGLRFQNPLWQITEIFTGSKFRQSVAEVKKFGREIVSNARTRRSRVAFESLITNEEVVLGSLVDSLFEAFRNPSIIADSALNFLSAGRDTTAQSFTWTLYALLRHPEAIVLLRTEVASVRRPSDGANKVDKELPSSPSTLSVSHLQPQSIPTTMSILYESLRLYPPVPFELKQCETSITLPDGTYLPQSSIVVWCIWALNRSREIWGRDADHFRPGRWIDSDGKLIAKSSSEFAVFNGGPRACLGKKMAELMAAWVLINVLDEFDFEEVYDGDGTSFGAKGVRTERLSQNSLTLPMQGGLPCKVTRREAKTKSDLKLAHVEDENEEAVVRDDNATAEFSRLV